LKKTENKKNKLQGRWFWYLLDRVLFDWTCQYGMDYGRPLVFASYLWFICTAIYLFIIIFGKRAAIVKEYKKSPGKDKQLTLDTSDLSAKSNKLEVILLVVWREMKLLGWAMFFSLMSAFNIGFRDFNFGRWLRMLLPQELDLRPVGFARTVSGVQALLSVYLFALFLLTYFGRPFE
jgi:hypothetical protein